MAPAAIVKRDGRNVKSARRVAARSKLFRSTQGVSVAVDLQPCDAQTGDAVPVDRALPGEKFLDRQLVATASLLDAESAAANGSDNDRLAAHDPSFGVRWRQVEGRESDGRERPRGLHDLGSAHFIQAGCIADTNEDYRSVLKDPLSGTLSVFSLILVNDN